MAGTERVDFLSNASATGSSMTVHGGVYDLYAEATWGGGTVKLQSLSPHGTWIDVPSASFTANGAANQLYLAPGQYRGNVATSTAAYLSAVSVLVKGS